MPRASGCIPAGATLVALACAAPLGASQPSLSECLEGSDFIGNAALSRDNGMSAQQFLDRMRQDFTLIHAFPSAARWFAHDADDEAYLMAEARAVFDQPGPPEQHRRTFLRSCVTRMGQVAPEEGAADPPTGPDRGERP
jgi:hypothetical protein